MSSESNVHERDHLDSVYLHAIQALPPSETARVEAQLAACEECRLELESLRGVVDTFASWPTGVLRPSSSLWERLERRIGTDAAPAAPSAADTFPAEPEWEEVAPGISCKLLATDEEKGYVSMLVRLAPGAEYPAHTHAAIEELFMLEGELAVDEKMLRAGDYLRSEPGTSDRRIWSETGCTGVLLTSIHDPLF